MTFNYKKSQIYRYFLVLDILISISYNKIFILVTDDITSKGIQMMFDLHNYKSF